MKQRLADYVADFLVSHGVSDVFSVVGGGAMHLNDALGHHEKLRVTYNHHEQACAIAAEQDSSSMCNNRTRWHKCDYRCIRWLVRQHTYVHYFWTGKI